MESRHDSENAEKILFKMRPTELVGLLACTATKAYTNTQIVVSTWRSTQASVTSVPQVDVMKEAYAQGLESDEDEDGFVGQIKPKDVGHNIYILAHQVDFDSFSSDDFIFTQDARSGKRFLSYCCQSPSEYRDYACVCEFLHQHLALSCWRCR